MKAVLQFRASPDFRSEISSHVPEDIDVVIVDEADKASFVKEMLDADALLHVLEPVTEAVMDAAPKLRLIQKIGVGVNAIDLEAAKQRGIAVANMPGTNSQAVAEHSLALMLATLRQIPMVASAVRDGVGWTLDEATFDRMGEIHGRTVGLVGFGEVPKRLAPVLTALGANVIYNTHSGARDVPYQFVSFDTLVAQADIVSLHIPLTSETEHIINEVSIARMKAGVVIVNTARGGLVEEGALYEALTTGRIRAVGLDTLAVEPALADHPLFTLDNVVVTPHIAWLTPETLSRSIGIAFENCHRLDKGQPLLYQINL